MHTLEYDVKDFVYVIHNYKITLCKIIGMNRNIERDGSIETVYNVEYSVGEGKNYETVRIYSVKKVYRTKEDLLEYLSKTFQ
jgi:hypothetical protein